MPERRTLDWRHTWELKPWDETHLLVQCVSAGCLRSPTARARQMYLVAIAELPGLEPGVQHRWKWIDNGDGTARSEHPLRGLSLRLIPLQMEIPR
jgi:hypothetical protein